MPNGMDLNVDPSLEAPHQNKTPFGGINHFELLFDHLLGSSDDCWREIETECPGCLNYPSKPRPQARGS